MSEAGRYRRAYPRIFRHPGFKALTPLGQRLALYLLYGPQSNRIGLFYMSLNTAAEDLDSTADTLRKGIVDISEAFGWMFDATARVFYIPTWWRWNDPGSPKVLQGNLKDLSEIPPCGLVDAFACNTQYLSNSLLDTFVEAIAIRIPKGTPTQYQSQSSVTKQNQERAARGRGFEDKAPPPASGSLDERLSQIAKAVKRDARSKPIDYQTEVVIHHARMVGVECNKSEALRALSAA